MYSNSEGRMIFLNFNLLPYVSPAVAVPEEPLTLSTQTNGLPQSVAAPLLVQMRKMEKFECLIQRNTRKFVKTSKLSAENKKVWVWY